MHLKDYRKVTYLQNIQITVKNVTLHNTTEVAGLVGLPKTLLRTFGFAIINYKLYIPCLPHAYFVNINEKRVIRFSYK